jgi:hypothetical protein
MFADQRNLCVFFIPYNVFDGRTLDLADGLVLLDVVENSRSGRGEDKTGSATVEDFVRLDRRLNGLDWREGGVEDLYGLPKRFFQ